MILKTLGGTKLARPGKGKIDGKSKVNGRDKVDSRDEISNDKVGDNEIRKKKNYQKTCESKKTVISIALGFFTLEARLIFIRLK